MPDWLLWLIFFVVVVPTVLGVGGDVFKRWIKLKERQLDHAATLAADRAAHQASHADRLEERVRVLERIVTDKGSDLSLEIDKLRDPPRIN